MAWFGRIDGYATNGPDQIVVQVSFFDDSVKDVPTQFSFPLRFAAGVSVDEIQKMVFVKGIEAAESVKAVADLETKLPVGTLIQVN